MKVAQHVLWFFGDVNLGVDGGHFAQRLFALMSSADEENFEKLQSLWPEEAKALRAVQREPWGLDWLRSIVKAALDGRELGLDFLSEVTA